MFAIRTRKPIDITLIKHCRYFSGKGGPVKPGMVLHLDLAHILQFWAIFFAHLAWASFFRVRSG